MFLADPRETGITLGTPGDSKGFADWLRELPNDRGTPEFDAAYRRMIAAAERETMFTRLMSSRTEAMAQAAQHRIDSVRQQTGRELENPFRQGYLFEARERVEQARARGEDVGPMRDAVARTQREIFTERLDEAAGDNPAFQFGQSLEQQAGAIATAAADEARNARADLARRGAGWTDTLPSEVAGAIWGSRRDPVSVVSLVAGPTLAAGKTVLARLLTSAGAQGFFNLGLEVLQHPQAELWRRERGEKPGSFLPSPTEAAVAFLSGAIPGLAIQGVVEKAGSNALRRVLTGEAREGDLERALRHVGETPDGLSARTFDAGVRAEGNEAAANAGLPRGISPDGVRGAIAHAEDPVHTPPPELPLPVPERPKSHMRLLDEALEGASETVDGKPVAFVRLDARDIGTDANAFQFKGGGDAAGVTDRLRNVTQWDPLAAGKFFFYEFADGRVVVADGHQRLGLAKRLSGEQGQQIPLDGYAFRQVDGWTPADVRALAAKKNMQEGTGDAIDVARVIRDRPDLVDGRLPVNGPTMKNAMAIARLSDEAFGMVANGVVPPNYGAAVGAMVADPINHAATIADLARFAPATEREARLLIGEIQSAGFVSEHQIDLFGSADARRSLMAERVKVLDQAMQSLVSDKKLFGTLAKSADTIEGAGNQLDRSANRARAKNAAQLGDLLARLALKSGPVSDALNRAAERMAGGERKGLAANGFLDEVREILDRDGLQGLLGRGELRPHASVEPGTPEALAAAEGASAARSESRMQKTDMAAAEGAGPAEAIQRPPEGQSAPEANLVKDVAVAGREDGGDMRLLSHEAALAEADRPALYGDLLEACKL